VGVVLTVLLSTHAHATTERIAVLIANKSGGSDLPQLRYPARDAALLSSVLTELGGFSTSDVVTVLDADAQHILRVLDDVERRVQSAKARGSEVVLLVYYSGHAQNGSLRMGNTTLEMSEVRRRLQESAADVRMAFVDSCGAGAMTREKGGALAPPFVVAVDDALAARGQVIITSSSESEVSQESDEIQGSFFTHYLATGLRGDADRNHDGRVTLDEAYAYAYGRTVAATANTRAGAQHPTYAYDLHGQGDVVMTSPNTADVHVDFPSGTRGRYFVVDLDRQLFVAEVDKDAGASSQLALPKGSYAIKKRADTHLWMQRVAAREKGVFVVDDSKMESVAFADDYAKGSPIDLVATVHRKSGLTMAAGFGAQGIVDSVDNGGLFPAVPLLVLRLESHDWLRDDVSTGVDAGFGSTASVRVVNAGTQGVLKFPVQYSQLQLGASMLYAWHLDDVELSVGGRVATLFMLARFASNAPVAQQSFLTITPGVVARAGYHVTSWAHAEIEARAGVLPYNVDAVRALGVFEATGALAVDF
jgi:hypothetical protein